MVPRSSKSCAAATRNHHHVQKLIRRKKSSQNETFDPFKTSSKFTKDRACDQTWPPEAPLILTHACHRFWKCYKTHHVLPAFGKMQNPSRLPRKNDTWTSKSAPNLSISTLLKLKFVPHHRGMHLFDISISTDFRQKPGFAFFQGFEIVMSSILF